MFLLAFHIIAVAMIVVIVWSVAHRMGRRTGERQLRRRLGLDPKLGGDLTPRSTPSQP